MLGKKFLNLFLGFALSSSVFAEEKTVGESLLKAIPNAAADALTTDLPVNLALASASAVGIVSGVPFMIVPTFTLGAFLGQLVRHTCKDYYTDGEPSMFCGAIAGATKYGSRSILLGDSGLSLAVTMLRGSLDIGIYEMDRPSLIEGFKNNDTKKVVGIIGRNELANEFLFKQGLFNVMTYFGFSGFQYKQSSTSVKIAFLVPALISASAYTTNQYFSEYVKYFFEFLLGTAETKEKEKEDL